LTTSTGLGIDVRRLAGSSAHLVEHLAQCAICQEAGTRFCSDVSELMAVVRADRVPLLGVRPQ
jgi:hypothetical protein